MAKTSSSKHTPLSSAVALFSGASWTQCRKQQEGEDFLEQSKGEVSMPPGIECSANRISFGRGHGSVGMEKRIAVVGPYNHWCRCCTEFYFGKPG